MELREILAGRLSNGTIAKLSLEDNADDLYQLVFDRDTHISYNALWVITHWPKDRFRWLYNHKDELIEVAKTSEHIGQLRLSMTLLERMDFFADEVRSDFLDFCLGKINSTDTYGVRSLAMKLAYKQCRHFPELINELTEEMGMINLGETSPALLTTRRNILKKIAASQKLIE